ncbi:PRA1 family protein B5-like [Curcuma longa]|uniref:PRA1 family protein B5-like n=1 Tax=Curcuma longa TaxID=136217 RepID=UPI003D9EB547
MAGGGGAFHASPSRHSASTTASNSDLVSGIKEQGKALISSQRPWAQLVDPGALALPVNSALAAARFRRNLAYFRSNYVLLVLAVLAVSLLGHPGALVALIALAAAWIFLFFARDQPILLFGRSVDNGTVLGVLCVVTVAALIFSSVGSTVFGAVAVGAAVVCLHAVLRGTDDLFLDEEEAASGGLLPPAKPEIPPRIV